MMRWLWCALRRHPAYPRPAQMWGPAGHHATWHACACGRREGWVQDGVWRL